MLSTHIDFTFLKPCLECFSNDNVNLSVYPNISTSTGNSDQLLSSPVFSSSAIMSLTKYLQYLGKIALFENS